MSKALPYEYPDTIYQVEGTDEISDTLNGLPDNELCLVVDGAIVQPEQITFLRNTCLSHLDAGIVGGIETLEIDVIASLAELKSIGERGEVPVEIALRKLFMGKVRVLKELDWGEQFFGMSLRKLGFQNYINTNVEIEENKNAENHNAKGLACKSKNVMGKSRS